MTQPINTEILDALEKSATLARIFADACDRARKAGEDKLANDPTSAAAWGVLYMHPDKAEAKHLALALKRELVTLVKCR